MKVFISWSGERSKQLAEALRSWLPSVVQAVKPYFSPDDIAKGSRWSSEIAGELEESKIGLICLTPDNLEAPWIMFESGALSKSLSVAKVCPLLFGIEPSDIQGPLVQFQAAPFSKTEMLKVVEMINSELAPSSLEPKVLTDVFEMWWPKLERDIEKILNAVPAEDEQTIRTERDLIEEILERVRRPSVVTRDNISPMAIEDLLRRYQQLREAVSDGSLSDVVDALEGISTPIEHIGRRFAARPEWKFDETSLRPISRTRRAIRIPHPDAMDSSIEDANAAEKVMKPTKTTSKARRTPSRKKGD